MNGGICIESQTKRLQVVASIVCIAVENGMTIFHGLLMNLHWVSCLGDVLGVIIYQSGGLRYD